MRESSVQPSASSPLSCSLARISTRSASADAGLDIFHFPDGTEFAFPSSWGVKQYISQNPTRFRTCSFRSLEQGDTWESEAGLASFVIPTGFQLEDLPLKRIVRPERSYPTKEGWFVDKARLFSILEAFIAGQPLPPIQVELTESGSLSVANGFHRYFASIIVGYSEIPVLREGLRHFAEARSEDTLPRSDALVLAETAEDGSIAHVEALVLLPKSRSGTTLGQQRLQRPVPCKSRYEPPAVRRERLLREEQERKQRELSEKAEAFRRTALSKVSADQERCHRMKRPSVTYAEKTTGCIKPAAPPTWGEEPALQ